MGLRRRGPFARWPRAADAVLGAVLFALTVAVVSGPDDAPILRRPDEVPVSVLAVFTAACAALYWRRRAPVTVLTVVVAAWAVTLGTGYSDLGGAAIVALYAAGRHASDDRRDATVTRAGVAAAAVVVLVDGWSRGTPWGEWVLGVVVMFVSWYIGRRFRMRAERAAEVVRQRAAETRRVLAEERTRIVRELHDVVAHRVSLMTVQAGAARAVATTDLDAALAAMGAVEEAGRQALAELRHLLGVLRPEAVPQVGSDGLGPQPGLAELPHLVERVRAAGIDVSLDSAHPRLPDRVDLFAYRIVQESLTNVLKHAGRGSRAHVRLGADADGVVIEVVDEGPVSAPAAVPDGRGHGIIGMRERANLLGGHLDAGPRAGGGFRVAAHLPVAGEPA